MRKKTCKKLWAMCISVSLCIATISGCGAEKTATNDEVQTMEKEQSIAQEQSGTEEQVVEETETETETETEAKLRIKSAKLELSQDIAVIYTAIIPEGYTDFYMIFEFCGNEYTVYGTQNPDKTYSFKFDRVLPQCMGENIKSTLYATFEGKEVSVCIEEYNVRTYCVKALAKNTDERLRSLLSDLLVYGAAAQKYKDYSTDNLVTDGLELTPREFVTLDATVSKKTLTGVRDENSAWKSAGLVYDNAMAMYIRFTANDVDDLKVKVTIEGREEIYSVSELETDSNGYYELRISKIYATEFDSTVTAIFLRDNEQVGQTMTYSVNSYIYSKQNSSDAALAELLKATYNYGVSAYEYSIYN